jgi:hypothetical protein
MFVFAARGPVTPMMRNPCGYDDQYQPYDGRHQVSTPLHRLYQPLRCLSRRNSKVPSPWLTRANTAASILASHDQSSSETLHGSKVSSLEPYCERIARVSLLRTLFALLSSFVPGLTLGTEMSYICFLFSIITTRACGIFDGLRDGRVQGQVLSNDFSLRYGPQDGIYAEADGKTRLESVSSRSLLTGNLLLSRDYRRTVLLLPKSRSFTDQYILVKDRMHYWCNGREIRVIPKRSCPYLQQDLAIQIVYVHLSNATA